MNGARMREIEDGAEPTTQEVHEAAFFTGAFLLLITIGCGAVGCGLLGFLQ